jgi:hypothetical protein
MTAAWGTPSCESSPLGTAHRGRPPLHSHLVGRKGVAPFHGHHLHLVHLRRPLSDGSDNHRSRRGPRGRWRAALGWLPSPEHRSHSSLLLLIFLVRGIGRKLTILLGGTILISGSPSPRSGIVLVALCDLRRFSCLMEVLPPLESGRGDVVPCPLLRQRGASHRHEPAPILQKRHVSKREEKG